MTILSALLVLGAILVTTILLLHLYMTLLYSYSLDTGTPKKINLHASERTTEMNQARSILCFFLWNCSHVCNRDNKEISTEYSSCQ